MPAWLPRAGLVVGAYVLAAWYFSFLSETEGLVTPHGQPRLAVIALGVVFLTLRVLVRILLPAALGFAAARGVTAWVTCRRARSAASPSA